MEETYARELDRLQLKRIDLNDQFAKLQEDKKIRMDDFTKKKL